MKTIYIHLLCLLGATHLSSGAIFGEPNPGDVDFIMTACSHYCPNARTPAETLQCVERKSQSEESIKQTQCWQESRRYAKLVETTRSLKK